MSRELSRNNYKKIKRSVDVFVASSAGSSHGFPRNEFSVKDSVECSKASYFNEPQPSQDILRDESQGEGNNIVDSAPLLVESGSDTCNSDTSSQCAASDDICFDEAFLASWALEANVSHVHLNSLLKGLKTHRCFQDFPVDARTLLKTVKHVSVTDVPPGLYHHFGIAEGILSCAQICKQLQTLSSLKVSISVDGLPLAKSSGACFWPILCCLQSLESQPIFPIGIYYGLSKPESANVFLEKFTAEATSLTLNGLEVNGKLINFTISYFVCDTPAKAFIRCTKGHTGFFSCTKCETEGEYQQGTVCFPQLTAKLRCHSDFVKQAQEEHHIGTSILQHIPRIDMIQAFPLDYMHLVCLGVQKKLLKDMWINGKPPGKLPLKEISSISNHLENLRLNIPSDFQRRPRSLNEVARWKATEFRQFLLYTGPLLLKNSFPSGKVDKLYVHFLVLHVAIRMLLNDSNVSQKQYAADLLQFFVDQFSHLYGENKISHNVHNLIHLVSDVEVHGSLENFSAFAFESTMQQLKKRLRKSDKPLQQIVKRLSETSLLLKKLPTIGELKYQGEHENGPLMANCGNPQFSKLITGHWHFSIVNGKDACCELRDGSIMEMVNICHRKMDEEQTEPCIVGHLFEDLRNFYEKPCPSSNLGIFEAKKKSPLLHCRPVTEIKCKMMCLPLEKGYLLLPLLHSEIIA